MSNEQKKTDLVTATIEAGGKVKLSQQHKLLYWFGVFQSGIFLLYAIFGYTVYFDMLVVFAFVYLFLVITEFMNKKKESQVAKTN